MAAIDVSKYAHSPIHKAIITKDYAALRRIISSLPQLCNPSDIHTESVSLSEESKADVISATIDRRDVPNRDTPLHLSVKLGDQTAAEILMQAGSDWSLQNEQGWSALQEAICNRQEEIAKIIFRHYQPLAWAKWCRRLPRLIGTMRRMRDFYMEISFHFESSVIPFISRIAPSDTYRIWKRGANLRADTSLSGFDGFKIQRSEQSFLFLGDGSEDGKVPRASLCVVAHRDKEVMNALDGAGTPAGEAEVHREVRAMSQTNMFRPGIDVTRAVLLPQTSTWRKQEKTEMVGVWKAKVYDMHNVVFSLKSRRVPGAMSDDEFFTSCNRDEAESDFGDVLSEEERKQLEFALKIDAEENGDDVIAHRHSCYEEGNIPIGDGEMTKVERKGRFSGWKRWEKTRSEKKIATSRSSLCVEEKDDLFGEEESSRSQDRRNGHQRREAKGSSVSGKDKSHENEYKKGLRPTFWLSQDFPLCTEELLPLLDILANKVKAIRRLRELLTTKLPKGTFPVKVAIPVVPTIRVIVTFTKFEELQPLEEFETPPSSPTAAVGTETRPSSSSWFQWIKSTNQHSNTSTNNRSEDSQDPFAIPSDYTWITSEEKKRKLQEKSKSGKTKGQKKS